MTIKMGLEKMFLLQLMDEDMPIPDREHRFHQIRRWRLDFAYPELKIGIEIEGGVWTRGRHNRPIGFIKDCEKYNMAQEMGWRIFRYTKESIEDWSAVQQIRRVLEKC